MTYRSGLEERLGKHLDKVGCPYLYEVEKFEYVTRSKYTPDFFLPNGVIIEAKGFFKPSDRRGNHWSGELVAASQKKLRSLQGQPSRHALHLDQW